MTKMLILKDLRKYNLDEHLYGYVNMLLISSTQIIGVSKIQIPYHHFNDLLIECSRVNALNHYIETNPEDFSERLNLLGVWIEPWDKMYSEFTLIRQQHFDCDKL